MYVCLPVCVYVCMYVWIYACMYADAHASMHVWRVCRRLRIHVWYSCVLASMPLCMHCVCLYVCMQSLLYAKVAHIQ